MVPYLSYPRVSYNYNRNYKTHINNNNNNNNTVKYFDFCAFCKIFRNQRDHNDVLIRKRTNYAPKYNEYPHIYIVLRQGIKIKKTEFVITLVRNYVLFDQYNIIA